MRVRSLALSHFRSWRRGLIEADGASVALHGPNGAGKTNILEALSLLVPGRGLRRAAVAEMARLPEGIGWRVVAQAGELEVETRYEPGEAGRSVVLDGKSVSQIALGEHLRQVWLTPAMDRLWMEGASDRRRFLDRMAMGFDPYHAEAAGGYEKAMRSRNRLLSEPNWDARWLDSVEAQLARLGARMHRGRVNALERIAEASEDAATAFPRAELRLAGDWAPGFTGDPDVAEVSLAAELAEELGRGRSRDAAAGRTLAGPHRSDLEAVYAAKGMPAASCSTGEQKALLISLCLANARALAAEGAAPVLLMDEVAAHLDAGRRAALYAEIAAMGAQAWMTGTGPELFEDIGPGAMLVAVTEGPEGSCAS